MITEQQLKAVELRVNQAQTGPWTAHIEGRDHESGSNFIMADKEDIELLGATDADYDFIANTRKDIPRLIQEIRELRAIKK